MGSSWLKLNINVQQDLKYSSKDININQKISSQK